MIKLKDYIKQLQDLEIKGYGELPVIYSSDDEGNSYHKIYSEPYEFLVENIEHYKLEAAFEYDDNDEIIDFIPNCIIVN